MNIKELILLSVYLAIVINKTVEHNKPPVFEGSLSQIIYRNKTTKVLTGVINVNEKEVIQIVANTALIQVSLQTEDKVKLVSEKKMKELIDQIRNELTVKTKMVFELRVEKPAKSQLVVKTKSYVTEASIVLFITKSYPEKVKTIINKLVQLKTKPTFIRYFITNRVRKVYKFRLIRKAIVRSNMTAKQLAEVLKEKVVGIQSIRYYDYLYPTRNIKIDREDGKYLEENRIKYEVQVFAGFFVRNAEEKQE